MIPGSSLTDWAGGVGGREGREGGEEVADGRRELSSLAASGELENYSFAWMDW